MRRRLNAGIVAAAILVKEGRRLHVNELTHRVVKSKLSGLGDIGTTPAQTLGVQLRRIPKLVEQRGKAYYSATPYAVSLPEEVVRVIKKLTPPYVKATEESLENIIRNDMNAFDVENGLEGEVNSRLINVPERDPKLRKSAIEIHGTKCMVCDFEFEEVYGDIGKLFIEVHHRNPLANSKGTVETNPANDLVVVCANCHRMIHRRRGNIPKIEDLRETVMARQGSYVVCINCTHSHVDLVVGKLYLVAKSERNDSESMLRVVDDSGEDYLYPIDWFVPLTVPSRVKRALAKS